MKLVCIDNQNSAGKMNLTVGKSYDVVSFIAMEPNGRIIEVPGNSVILMESLYKKKLLNIKVKVKNDVLVQWPYDVSLFKTLEEWRDIKLEELGI